MTVNLSTYMKCGFVRKNNVWDECFKPFLFIGNEISKPIRFCLSTGRRTYTSCIRHTFNVKRHCRIRQPVEWGRPSCTTCRLLWTPRWNFVEHAQCFRQRYEVDLSVFGQTNNHFLGTIDTNIQCFEQLEFQFHKFFENHVEQLLSTRTNWNGGHKILSLVESPFRNKLTIVH